MKRRTAMWKKLRKKPIKDAPKWTDGEEKQNLKDRTDVTSVNKNLEPAIKVKVDSLYYYLVLQIKTLCYRNVTQKFQFQLL